MTAVLTMTSDMDLLDFRRIPQVSLIKFSGVFSEIIYRTKALTERKTFEITAELTRPSQSVTVLITSVSKARQPSNMICRADNVQETIAGVKVDQVYKPKVSSKEYPTMDTRPPTTTVGFQYILSYPRIPHSQDRMLTSLGLKTILISGTWTIMTMKQTFKWYTSEI